MHKIGAAETNHQVLGATSPHDDHFGPQHPPLTAAAALLTQCFDRDLPRQRRRQVDAHEIHVLVEQHVVDPVRVEGNVHLLGQLLRLLLRAAPQRFDSEAFVL